jgi:hypothetical protein
MQTITFTTDDNIGQLLHDISAEKHQSLDDVIAESVRYYANMLARQKLQQQLKQASYLTAQQSFSINQSLEASNADGI